MFRYEKRILRIEKMKTETMKLQEAPQRQRTSIGPLDIEEHDFGSNGNQSICDEESALTFVARAKLPTRYGEFTIAGFLSSKGEKEHTALIKGQVAGKRGVPVRIHSECHTGDIFGSLKCDCREQLEASMRYIASKPSGVLIYLRQEGRGIGLLNKIKAYHLQDLGLDTIEANESLGFPGDLREYGDAAKIISILQIQSVALLTNNPEKIEGLEKEGIEVTHRIPLHATPNDHNKRYLSTKKNKMGHLV
jgi:GTP cyclohydrolase II